MRRALLRRPTYLGSPGKKPTKRLAYFPGCITAWSWSANAMAFDITTTRSPRFRKPRLRHWRLSLPEKCDALRRRAKGVLCIGDTGNKLADAMKASASDVPPVYRCGDMKMAVETARKIAKPGDIVLLSTGYKSFDQFDNYEQRGNTFAELARQSSASG